MHARIREEGAAGPGGMVPVEGYDLLSCGSGTVGRVTGRHRAPCWNTRLGWELGVREFSSKQEEHSRMTWTLESPLTLRGIWEQGQGPNVSFSR